LRLKLYLQDSFMHRFLRNLIISHRKLRISGFLVTLLLTINATTITAASPYDLIDLGTLGGDDNFAFSINNLNEVTGNSSGAIIADELITEENPATNCQNSVGTIKKREFCSHGYLYTSNTLFDLGDLADNQDGDFRTFGYSINDNTIVVGHATEIFDDGDPDTTDSTKHEVAVISTSGGAFTKLPFPAESLLLSTTVLPQQRALDINSNNLIVGYSLIKVTNPDNDEESEQYRAYIFDLSTMTFNILPVFSNEVLRTSAARAINNLGQVVGYATSEDEGNVNHAFLWDPLTPDTSIDLGTLGGPSSGAYDVNDLGIIVGVTETSDDFFANERLAFIYDASLSTPMILIPEFSDHEDFDQSKAYAINNSNQIVGTAQITSGFNSRNTAFRYDYDTDNLVNLNDMVDCSLNWELLSARDINDNGAIVGTGTVDGEVHSFLLIPTVETEPTNCTAIRKQIADDKTQELLEGAGSTSPLYLLLLIISLMSRRRKPIS